MDNLGQIICLRKDTLCLYNLGTKFSSAYVLPAQEHISLQMTFPSWLSTFFLQRWFTYNNNEFVSAKLILFFYYNISHICHCPTVLLRFMNSTSTLCSTLCSGTHTIGYLLWYSRTAMLYYGACDFDWIPGFAIRFLLLQSEINIEWTSLHSNS